MKYFAKVILPLALSQRYTYAIPDNLIPFCKIGIRVEVNFGKQKMYTAIVAEIITDSPSDYLPKEILNIIDDTPIITTNQLQLWQWIAKYYMCTEGEVMDAALPNYFKLKSNTAYLRNFDVDFDIHNISDEEYLIIEAFQQQTLLSHQDIDLILMHKKVAKTIKSLLERKLILIEEQLDIKYKPKTNLAIKWSQRIVENKELIKSAFDLTEKFPKQQQLLLAFIELSKTKNEITKKDLLKRCDANSSSIDSLIEKDIFQQYDTQIHRINTEASSLKNEILLTEAQQEAKNKIEIHWKEKNIVLLHGATASGKTHIYASIIQDIILQNGQVLYLVPEIALTTQLVKRLSILFGNVSVYHSKFNPAERIETWLHVASGKANIIIGARSALFLPFTNLKLIILDEEHDSSFKQSETNPKYHARNVAQYLAHLHSSKVLLGSATPSFDSYFLAKKEKIGLVTLQERYFENEKPEIKLIKLDSKTLPPHGMSDALLDNINLQLKAKKQSILFYHRRAFAPYIVCTQCEWVPYCKHCDIALNYHKWSNDLKCHICGYKQNIPKKCPACANTYIIQKGIGTERIEEDTQIIFPEATIARMDQDTTRQKNSHEKILAKLEDGELDILVGTQMVTKGIDTNNVNLVAVLNTDVLFHFSDFRAKERAMQLLLQVMGRAGRRNQRGVVVLQAYNIHNEYIKSLDNFDFKELFDKEIIERNLFNYPPFSKLIIIQLKHKELEVVEEAALSMAAGLKEKYKDAILGPAEPHISKVKNLFLRDIMVKINPNTYHIDLIKEDIFIVAKKITQYEKYRQVSIVYDVDPY